MKRLDPNEVWDQWPYASSMEEAQGKMLVARKNANGLSAPDFFW